jgi:hypothetical protein
VKKMLTVWIGTAFLCLLFGCRSLPPSSGITSNAISQKSPSPATSNQINSIAINLASTNQAAVAVGTNGLILLSTSTGSSSGAHFPNWTIVNSPTSQTLNAVAFDLNSIGTPSNVLAVGNNGTILENTNAGSASPSGWALGSSDSNFTLSDPNCPSVNASNFSANLLGASINSATGTSQNAVIVGAPFVACNSTKGTIAVSTQASSDGVFPYSGWTLVDAYGSNNAPIPNETFNGVSFSEDSSSATYVVVVGSNGDIFRGLVPQLTSASGWTLDQAGNGVSLNSVAIAQDNLHAIAVGNNGTIFTNSTLGASSWTQVPSTKIPSGFTATNFKSVFFVPGNTLTAIIVGANGSILLVQNCCDPNSTNFTISNVTPSLTGEATATLTGVWASIGTPGGLALAAGFSQDGAGFILENDNGGTTSPTGWYQVYPNLNSTTLP